MKASTEQYLLDTISERAKEMIQNEAVQAHMMKFSSKKEAEKWLFNAAIATLIGPGK